MKNDNPESKVEMLKQASVMCLVDEDVCFANTKSRVCEKKSNPSMEICVCCQVCLENVAGCVCQAKSNTKSKKVISKTKLRIHTVSEGKFSLEREGG